MRATRRDFLPLASVETAGPVLSDGRTLSRQTEADPGRFRRVAHALAKRGGTTDEIEKLLGGNGRRYFCDVFGG